MSAAEIAEELSHQLLSMKQQINLDELNDITAAVRSAVSRLDEGELVSIPDEVGTLVLARPDQADAARRLQQQSDALGEAFQVVALAHRSVLDDYVNEICELGEKLASRCWPGPVALRFGESFAAGLTVDWPMESRKWGYTEGGRSFLVPAHSFAYFLLRQLSTPMLGLVVSAQSMEKMDLSCCGLEVSSSETRFREGMTVARILDSSFEIERSGIVSERVLSRLSGEVYLFVCTGNTCRSPMAEALFRRMLENKLQCRDDELLDKGYAVASAGLAAYPGASANPEAIRLLQAEGIDLTAHESQPVTAELLAHCDHIITMTQSHRDAILNSLPELAGKVRTLAPDGRDISDPFGAGPEEYKRCRDEIEGYLKQLLDEQTNR